MDLVRSCYSTTCQFFPGVDHPVTINWYHCPPGALPFPTGHLFASRNWDAVHNQQDGVAEVSFAPRTYSKGRTPPLVTGQHFDGPLDYFQSGVPWDPSRPPTARNAFGLILDCAPGEVDAEVTAGEVSGGVVDWSTSGGITCASVPPPLVLYCKVSAIAYNINLTWDGISFFGFWDLPALCGVSGLTVNLQCAGDAWSVVLLRNAVFGNITTPVTSIQTTPFLRWTTSGAFSGWPDFFGPDACSILDVVIQTVPFDDDRLVTAGETSGGGVDWWSAVDHPVTAGETSGGGVDVQPVRLVTAGEISGGSVTP